MKKKSILFFVPLVLIMVVLSGCITPPPPQKTQLQIREFQTRSYDTKDYKMVMKAVMSALQDDNYIIEQANAELGLITAQKELDIQSTGEVLISSFFAALGGSEAEYRKNSITTASANISEFGDQTRVRINFQNKIMDNKGKVVKIQQIGDEKFYQTFFSKVDKSIFLGKEKI